MSVDLLKGRYELMGKLGSGGFSTVFKAYDVLLDREVAIKILKASLHEDEELVQRFLLEAKLTSKLAHPNTLTVHDFGRDEEGHCFFVTELLVGQSLHERLYRSKITVKEALTIASQITLGLGEAHSKEIVHRDIKPGNIFLIDSHIPNEPHVKLLDFGIAKSIGLDGQTVTGQMMGTPTYMSPEQIVNIKEVDHRTDIYSLGVVLFHMLSGAPPFKGESYWDTMRMHMQDPLPPLLVAAPVSHLPTKVLDDTQKLLKTMMAKEKSKRPSSAEEAQRQINSILQAIKQSARTQAKASSSSTASSVQSSSSELSSTSEAYTPAPTESVPQAGAGTKQSQPESSSSLPAIPNIKSIPRASQMTEEESSPVTNILGFLNELEEDVELAAPSHRFDSRDTAPGGSLEQTIGAGQPIPPIDPFSPEAQRNANQARRRPSSMGQMESPLSFQDGPSTGSSIGFGGERSEAVSNSSPLVIKTLRVLILDPNEFAGESYKRGLIEGGERRQELDAQGSDQKQLLSVSVSNTEQELLEDLEWGADLLLFDLKARDGAREKEGIQLLQDLRVKCPDECRIIAICKDRDLTVEVIEAGADAVLVKPVRKQQLFDAASVYLWGS